MTTPRMSMALVNSSARGGGAEAMARQLLEGFRKRGHDARLLVGRGESDGPHVHAFSRDLRARVQHALAGPARIAERRMGLETYRYPATRRMLELLPHPPELVHLHNLHGGYFDLRVLPGLSAALPVAMTLHDAWLLSGHCAHSMGCDRWQIGCGSCPDLDIYPAVRRDATARNWARKREIFARSRLYVATPSRWLADKVGGSILSPSLAELKVIPNGVDLETFRPGDRLAARSRLSLAPDEPVLLFVGRDTGPSGFKDLPTAEGAAARAAELLDRPLTLLVLGDEGTERRQGRALIRRVAFESDPVRVARCYQAADLYLHAARADTFPSTVLEALACGTPVVATAVGGVPEQIRGLSLPGSDQTGSEGAGPERSGRERAGREEPTGVLVPPGDADAMARALVRLLPDEDLLQTLGRNARRDAERRFDAEAQCEAYLAWFWEILARRGEGR